MCMMHSRLICFLTKSILLFCLAFSLLSNEHALSINVSGSWEHKIFVDCDNGADSESCFQGDIQSPCATVNMALKGLRYNSTVIYVSPGTYTLENGNETTINGKDKIAIIGSDENVVIICHPLSGLIFNYLSMILIENITLFGCGKEIMFHIQEPVLSLQFTVVYHFQAAMNIHFSDNVMVNRVSVLNSNGTGLLLVNINSNITVENSFISNSKAVLPDNLNTLETYLIGGGVIVFSTNTEDDMNYEIRRSSFNNNEFKIHKSQDVNCLLDIGGGVTLLSYYASPNLFVIDSCSMTNNTRGLFILQYSKYTVVIRNSDFFLNWENSIINANVPHFTLQLLDVSTTQNFTIVSSSWERLTTKILPGYYEILTENSEISVTFNSKNFDHFHLNFDEACSSEGCREGICSDNGVDYTGHCPTPYSVCYGAGCYCSIGRTGRYCGQCKNGYSVAINSHYLECVPTCDSLGKVAKGWAALIGLEFVPITIMVAVIAILNVNLNQGSLNAYIFFCQVLTMPFPFVGYPTWLVSTDNGCYYQYNDRLIRGLLIPFSMWNLDFINIPSYPSNYNITDNKPGFSLCISSNTTPLGALSFWYIIAFYPLVLLLILYSCIALYYKGCKCVMCIVRPVHRVLARFWKTFDIQPSLITTLASLYTLCFTQLAAISLKILHLTYYVDKFGDTKIMFFYDGTQQYFKGFHSFAGIFAILVLLFLILSILYLSFYPFRWFQYFLNKLKLKKTFLISLTDVFTRPYIDGTQLNFWNHRCFAGIHFALQILIMLIYYIPQFKNFLYQINVLEVSVCALAGAVIFIFKPYKRKIHCFVETLLFAVLIVIIVPFDGTADLVMFIYAILILVVIPYCVFWIVRKCKVHCKHTTSYIHLDMISGSQESVIFSSENEAAGYDNFDADRFMHPNRYVDGHVATGGTR